MYSSTSSRNKHKKKKGHQSENNKDPDISFNDETKLFHCQTTGCATTAKYKYNIVKHLKSCYSVNKNRRKKLITNFAKAAERNFPKCQTDRDSQQFHDENNPDSVAQDEITGKGT